MTRKSQSRARFHSSHAFCNHASIRARLTTFSRGAHSSQNAIWLTFNKLRIFTGYSLLRIVIGDMGYLYT